MIPVQNTTLSSTFDFWRGRTNELANYLSTCVITTDANSATVNTVGNAVLTGMFTANALTVGVSNGTVNAYIYASYNSTSNVSSIKLGNNTSNTTLSIPTASQYGNNFHLAANGAWTYVSVTNNQVSHIGNNIFGVDAYRMSEFNGAEYLLSVKDNVGNNFLTTKVLTTHDTFNAFITEYASFSTNTTPLGRFTTQSNATHVILYFTSFLENEYANSTIKFVRTVV